MLRILGHSRNSFFRAFAGIALLAMVVRALIPAGYMPSAVQDGNFLTLTLCTAHGNVDVLIDPKTGAMVTDASAGEGESSEGNGNGAPCVFAALAAFTAPPAESAIHLVFSSRHAVPVETSHVVNLRHNAEIPWSTGPPSLT